MMAKKPDKIGEKTHDSEIALIPAMNGNVGMLDDHRTELGPAAIRENPTTAPTMECVVDTGNSQYVARIILRGKN